MREEYGHTTCAVIMSFLIGGLAGAGAALLLAPQSGKETRQKIADLKDDIKDRATEYTAEAREKVEDVIERGKDYVHDAKEKAEDAIEKGRDYVDKKKSVISSALEAGKEAYKKEKGSKSS